MLGGLAAPAQASGTVGIGNRRLLLKQSITRPTEVTTDPGSHYLFRDSCNVKLR